MTGDPLSTRRLCFEQTAGHLVGMSWLCFVRRRQSPPTVRDLWRGKGRRPPGRSTCRFLDQGVLYLARIFRRGKIQWRVAPRCQPLDDPCCMLFPECEVGPSPSPARHLKTGKDRHFPTTVCAARASTGAPRAGTTLAQARLPGVGANVFRAAFLAARRPWRWITLPTALMAGDRRRPAIPSHCPSRPAVPEPESDQLTPSMTTGLRCCGRQLRRRPKRRSRPGVRAEPLDDILDGCIIQGAWLGDPGNRRAVPAPHRQSRRD